MCGDELCARQFGVHICIPQSTADDHHRGGGANMIGPDRVKKIRVEMFMVEISGVEKVLKYSILQSVIFGI